MPNRQLRVPRRGLQLSRPVFTKPDDWSPYTVLPELSGIVALDTENKDPGLSSGYGTSWPHGLGFTCGIAISWSGGDFYLPYGHSEGNTDKRRVIEWLKVQAAKPDVTFVYANCQYDLGWLWREGITPLNLPHDVQGMAALLDEFKFSYSLDSLGREYLGEGKSDEAFSAACAAGGLLDPKSNMDLVPGWIAEAYGVQDARLTRDLYLHFLPMLEAEDLIPIYNLERECYLVGFDMKRNGVRVDTDEAERQITRFERLRDEKIELVARTTGVVCSATDNVSLARALRVENPDLDLPKTTQGRDSIRKEVMESLHSPVADAINSARRYDKAINTFLQGYILESSVKGRIHADFNPLRRSGTDAGGREGMKGTVTGRWSCTDPNLQNVSARDIEIGVAVRRCFVPEEGEQWVKADYASQEPRLTVYYAERAKLRGGKEMADRFRIDPMTDLHGETATLMGVPRPQAKVINLSLAYGAGGAKLCKQLGLPTEWTEKHGRRIEIAGREGKRLLDRHMQAVPFMRALQKMAEKTAQTRGYIITLGGRRCHFQKNGDEYEWTYTALNKIIQGSAADQMKAALCHLRREKIPTLLTVHDEADFSVPRGEKGELILQSIRAIMEQAIPISIPMIADIKVSDTWAGS